MTRLFKFFLLALLVSPAANATSYVDGKPLSSVVTQSIRDCRASNKWQVPIITWGADEVTIDANGNNLTTQSKSIFSKHNLNITLKREDKFEEQVKSYLNCDSPFLRATIGMASMASDITENDPRTKMVAIYQHSWSAGGDVLVARSNIKQPSDLKGKTIVVQRFGPHVDYLMKILTDANLTADDVKIKWTQDLTGKTATTPADALKNDGSVDAVFVISTDAATLTSGDKGVGDGSEGSVKGAHVILSTKSASRIITDIYFVRKDFYMANKDAIAEFTKALLEAEEDTRGKAKANGGDWNNLMKVSGQILLDDVAAVDDAKGLWHDAETTGRQGNAQFFADFNYPRSFTNVSKEVQIDLQQLHQLNGTYRLTVADWDWQTISNVANVAAGEVKKFDQAAATNVVSQMQSQGKIDSDTLFSFEIFFQANQQEFPVNAYREQFSKVIDLASTYSGAVITVEGYADPLEYLRKLKAVEDRNKANAVATSPFLDPTVKLTVQSARGLSVKRAGAVVKAIIDAGNNKGVVLDTSQFVTVGMGYDNPKTGVCGDRPCEPKNQQAWLSNMRVVFRIVNVEAESSVFKPLN